MYGCSFCLILSNTSHTYHYSKLTGRLGFTDFARILLPTDHLITSPIKHTSHDDVNVLEQTLSEAGQVKEM